MASDAVAFIRALGLEQVDLFGFSMGGMIAQVIAAREPQLVRKLILAGTGPAGGEGITKVTRIAHLDTLRGLPTLQDPKQFLFFTRTPNGRRAGNEFLARLKERTANRDKRISLRSYRAQLTAIHGWGTQQPADLSVIGQSAAPPTQAVRQLGGTFGVALAIASLGISGAIDAGFDRIWWIVMIGGLATSALVLPMRTSSAHVHVAVAVVASPALTVAPGGTTVKPSRRSRGRRRPLAAKVKAARPSPRVVRSIAET